MDEKIEGIHHITAIAGEPQRNYDFYTRFLGLRFVKKTVNFDDPGTYHFYFGDEHGTPGTILTFFPWVRVRKGINGNGMATEIGYSIPEGSMDFWIERMKAFDVKHGDVTEHLGEKEVSFDDPDGLKLKLIMPLKPDLRKPWIVSGIDDDVAVRGFQSITLQVQSAEPTARVLTDVFGYRLLEQSGQRYRYITDASDGANIVDIIASPQAKPGIVAGGTNHHVAFRVSNEEVLMHFREKVLAHGLNITPKIDRNYFFSLYFREPGGVLFEIATDNPGFSVDEPLEALGTHLKLPIQYETQRERIEQILPPLQQ